MAEQGAFFNDYDDNAPAKRYVLRLFITGASPNSIRAVENIRTICQEHLHGNYELEIIDIHQQPAMAEGENIIALPLLVKKQPGNERRMIGDMSNTVKVLEGLGLEDKR